MKRNWLIAVVVFAAVGIILSGISLQNFNKIQEKGFEESSFCSVNEYVNCDAVEASSYARFLGVPSAGLGLCYYLLSLLFAAYAVLSKKERKATISFAWWISLGGLLFSIYMAYVSFIVLRMICVTCIGMYIVSIMLAIGFYMAVGTRFSAVFEFGRDYVINLFVPRRNKLDFEPQFFSHLFVAILVFAVGIYLVNQAAYTEQTLTREKLKEMLDAHYRQSLNDVKIDEARDPLWGNPKAKVTIVEYSEFLCPFCKKAAFTVRPYLREYGDKVRYFFVNYPLDANCNENFKESIHPGSCLAARAAHCANEQGKFWEYHDDLFRGQKRISPETVTKLAKDHGLNLGAFEECIGSVETENFIREDIESGKHVYIKGVPSIFVNGRPLNLWRIPELLHAVIKREIKETKKGSLR